MPEQGSVLSRLKPVPRVSPEAERALLGAAEVPVVTNPEPLHIEGPEPVSEPAPSPQTKPRRAGKQSAFDSLAASVAPSEEPVPFSVRLPRWLRQAVVQRIKTKQAEGVRLTQDMVTKQALMDFFGLEEPE